VNLVRDKKYAAAIITTVHTIVSELITRTGYLGHKLYRTIFSSPDLFNNLHMKTINCCGNVTPNRNAMPSDWKETQTETG
jgi:hypothetical protein